MHLVQLLSNKVNTFQIEFTVSIYLVCLGFDSYPFFHPGFFATVEMEAKGRQENRG